MRVILATDALGCGGKERQLLEVALGLIRQGTLKSEDLQVVSLSERGFFDTALESARVRVLRVPRRSRFDFSVLPRVRDVVREFRPDILHSFSALTSFVLSVITARSRIALVDNSVQNVFAFRGAFERALFAWNFHWADLVVGNSRLGLKAKGAPTAKSRVLYNGYDFRRQQNLKPVRVLREELGAGTRHMIGMVARFDPHKDWTTFFSTAHAVYERRRDVIFLAVGDGRTKARYEDHYSRLPYVKFLGWRKDVESIENACSVGVLCSPSEGIPNGILEFMALGKPTAAACGGAVRELLEHGRTGFVAPPGSAEDLSQYILQLLDDDATALTIGQQARRAVEARFSAQVMMRVLLEIYHQALSNRSD